MEEEEALWDVGLTPAEAKVYLALLETGPSTAGPVIKNAGLHRATTYQIFQRLSEKGLVSSVIEGGKRHFMPASPRRLLDAMRQREERLMASLPRLEAMFNLGREKQEITVYSGVAGLRTALGSMLQELGRGGEYYDFGVSGLFRKVMGPYFQAWQREKKRMGITSYVIFNEALKKDREFFREYCGRARFHPREYSSLTDTMIYRDTVVLLVWTAKPPIAIVVRNAENAKSYRNQFMLMWRNAKK